jgi:hypothetical protein
VAITWVKRQFFNVGHNLGQDIMFYKFLFPNRFTLYGILYLLNETAKLLEQALALQTILLPQLN